MRVRLHQRRAALFGLLVMLCATTLAWTLSRPRPSRAEPAEIDPKAIAALTQSVEYLRSLPAFTVDAVITHDEVVQGNFNLQRSSQVHVSVVRPDRLRAEVSSHLGKRLFVYDGKTLSVYLENENYYATVPAPATLRETLDAALQKHAIELPLTDLLYAAMGGDLHKNVRAAGEIGPTLVNGEELLQLAFRGPTLDWQLWLSQGDQPLPRKIAITTTSSALRPQYSAVLTWDLSTALSDELFEFTPPSGALPIQLGSAVKPSR